MHQLEKLQYVTRTWYHDPFKTLGGPRRDLPEAPVDPHPSPSSAVPPLPLPWTGIPLPTSLIQCRAPPHLVLETAIAEVFPAHPPEPCSLENKEVFLDEEYSNMDGVGERGY